MRDGRMRAFFNWTTIVTFLMVFLIPNSQKRDAAAMQAKLDELLTPSTRRVSSSSALNI